MYTILPEQLYHNRIIFEMVSYALLIYVGFFAMPVILLVKSITESCWKNRTQYERQQTLDKMGYQNDDKEVEFEVESATSSEQAAQLVASIG